MQQFVGEGEDHQAMLEFRHMPLNVERLTDVYRSSGRPFAEEAIRQFEFDVNMC